MKVKYTIKSIEFYKKRIDDDTIKVQWCPISQNVDCILGWTKELDLKMLKSKLNNRDNEWTFTLEGRREAQEKIQERLFAQGAKIYNISYHKTSWFD